ncbi:MAG TPA: exodeoxyribonuclease VII large subunit [Lentisphaeria bacterium]|nr:MAG: exodeoxyribonuclease VII large subunit [Lentisphaerae bacterium GWF2_38_69]HBM17027.1 exodeoxyribonuclease VII large subunit [Lentisphaeria bacterium]
MQDRIWKISEVNSVIKEVLEGALSSFWIEAEIGTMTVHSSGHVYLVLKDESSQMKAVVWKGARLIQNLKLATGSKIEAFGAITVYEPRGEYQFTIRDIRPLGLGDLQRKFEEIKKRLLEEGLFDSSRKKKIPLLPKRIGVITSPTGAAIQDFLNIINRRFPNIHIQIYPASVQGAGAEKDLIKGIQFFNRLSPPPDVLVLTRGGGSMEDLWPFNNEALAREIFASLIPTISAVGHEIDFTICDFVADLRVPTPSSAAELVVAKQDELTEKINNLMAKLNSSINIFIEKTKRHFERLSGSYVFKDPLRMIFERVQTVDEFKTRISHAVELRIEKESSGLERLKAKLQTLNPLNVLNRGYAILQDENSGKIIDSPDTPPGTAVKAMLAGGYLNMKVLSGKYCKLDEK